MQPFIVDIKQKVVGLLEENATTLLTAGGVVGTVATAILTGRATFKASEIIRQEELEHIVEADGHTMGLSNWERTKLVWPLYIPPVLTGSATVASIVLANRMSAQKAAALAAAYGLAERNLSEYKEKVAEKLTGPKQQQIEDELAQEQANRTPGGENLVIIEGGDVMCLDRPTGRYFKSTMEKINQAVNATNAEILRHNGANASYFYDELELEGTTWSDRVGWGIGEQISLTISTVIGPGNKPCIAFDFSPLPSFDYDTSHR